MAYEIQMRDERILQVAFSGDATAADIIAFRQAIEPYLATTTEGKPLHLLVDASRDGRYDPSARHKLAELGSDPRVSKIAVVNPSRYARLVPSFVSRLAGRNRVVKFFAKETEAIQWLKMQVSESKE